MDHPPLTQQLIPCSPRERTCSHMRAALCSSRGMITILGAIRYDLHVSVASVLCLYASRQTVSRQESLAKRLQRPVHAAFLATHVALRAASLLPQLWTAVSPQWRNVHSKGRRWASVEPLLLPLALLRSWSAACPRTVQVVSEDADQQLQRHQILRFVVPAVGPLRWWRGVWSFRVRSHGTACGFLLGLD